MKLRSLVPAVGLAAALVAPACGPGRTAAATQPTPAAFDPAQSEPAALETVDASLAALGGHAAWDAVKQLSFEVKYVFNGEVKGWYRHHWDRWNGRHNFQSADLTTGDGRPEAYDWVVVFYDLFDAGAKAHGTYAGKEVARESADKFRGDARKRLAEDAYMLTMVHKLRDPGVILAVAGELPPQEGTCDPGCKTIKVTFDPAVGKDTWFVNYNTATHLPEIIEKQMAQGRIGFKILGWTDAGGLKFPTKLQNIGLPGEIFEFSAIEVGEPDDRLYLPQVQGAH